MSGKSVLSCCIALFFTAVTLIAFAGVPETGKAAPEFALKSQDGTVVKLSDFRGKWVVLYFYPKDFTSGCTLQARNFQRDLAVYEKQNAVILGVSVDSAASHKDFCAKESLTFKLLADADKKVSTVYGSLGDYGGNAMALRNTFIIDPGGKVARVFEGVKPAGHSQEVLAALSQLQRR
jgi:peroxiredoxin Q/BCP